MTALGSSDTNKAIAIHVDDEDKLDNETLLSLGQCVGRRVPGAGACKY